MQEISEKKQEEKKEHKEHKEKIKILVIGNGFGGVYVLKHLAEIFKKNKNKNIELSMIGEKNYFLFTPLLHEVATGSINPENIIEPIRNVLGHCLKNFYLGKAELINQTEQTVKLGENFIKYDYLVLAPGAETNFCDIKNAKENTFTLKSLEDAINFKNHCITQIERATHEKDEEIQKQMLKFVIIGGGPTGVELASELQEFIKDTFINYYPKKIIDDISITLVDRGPRLLASFHENLSKKSLDILKKKGVEVLLNTKVLEVNKNEIILSNVNINTDKQETSENIKIKSENMIWVAGVKPINIDFTENIEKAPDNRIVINEYLQTKDFKNIFALGDVAFLKQDDRPLPTLAQVAEREAKIVAENIKLSIQKKALKSFYYRHSGNLLSLGKWIAIGEVSNFTFSGKLTWWIWRTVYLSKLISTRKKFEVALDWTINMFSPRDISQI